MYHEKTTTAARGKWKGILLSLGIPEKSLSGKHSPCPLCTSKNNFRFDDKDRRGTYICTCGAGDGMKLAIEYTGKTFADVARIIDDMVGNVKADAPQRPALTDDQRRDILKRTYLETQEVQPGDLVHRYLAARGVEDLIYPKALRFAPKLRDGEGGIRPAMVAMVGVPGQDKFVSMHRTFLKPDGTGKAEMEGPRKMMPGDLPEGACVMLSDYTPGGPLGIAEGIETALAASALFGIPVWSAINTAILKKWMPPAGCTEVAIFADHDPKFGGHAAAWTLAHRLAVKGIDVSVHVPDQPGKDFNDILLERGKA